MRLPVLFIVILLTAVEAHSQQISIGSVSQRATCAVAGVSGNVTVNCPGVDPTIVHVLNEQFKARLRDKDLRVEQLTTEANEWKDRFLDLTRRLTAPGIDATLKQKVQELLNAGRLDEAGHMLDQALEAQEQSVGEIAKIHFARAAVYELQFEPLKALPHYEIALRYRPDNPDYGMAYGHLLYEEKAFDVAEPVFKAVLKTRREQERRNGSRYLPQLATTLNILGSLYSETRRFADAERAYAEALQLYRALVNANPLVYRPHVAQLLNNLGLLYTNTGRVMEAEIAYTEALSIRRNLATGDTSTSKSHVAQTLNNIGILYSQTQRSADAEKSYSEALRMYRDLARVFPRGYLADVAMTLNNVGVLYSSLQEQDKAETAYIEALQIRRKLVIDNPAAYEPGLAITLNDIGGLYRNTQRPKQAEEAYKEALNIRRRLASSHFNYLPDVAATLLNMALLYKDQGQDEAAKRSCDEVDAIGDQIEASKDSLALYVRYTTICNAH